MLGFLLLARADSLEPMLVIEFDGNTPGPYLESLSVDSLTWDARSAILCGGPCVGRVTGGLISISSSSSLLLDWGVLPPPAGCVQQFDHAIDVPPALVCGSLRVALPPAVVQEGSRSSHFAIDTWFATLSVYLLPKLASHQPAAAGRGGLNQILHVHDKREVLSSFILGNSQPRHMCNSVHVLRIFGDYSHALRNRLCCDADMTRFHLKREHVHSVFLEQGTQLLAGIF